MKILVLNCGSSSVKYQLFNMDNKEVLAKGLVERIGTDGARLVHKPSGKDKYILEKPMKDHKIAVKLVLDALVDKDHGVINSMKEISAVGHRVLHGGEKYADPVLIDDKVIEAIKDCIPLGPLHNPANLTGINVCKELMPGVPMVAVFDTGFHQTMPDYAYRYPLPEVYYKKYGIRRYGFHGTSHRYVSKIAIDMLGGKAEGTKIITCHLGNGASLAAVKDGKCYDTSMGLTPLEGLEMGTRCGDIDPAVVTFLIRNVGMSADEVDTLMNKKSGFLGVSELSSDFRDIKSATDAGNKKAKLAYDIFVFRVKKYIGAYAAAMGGVDAIVFTAGLGENACPMRERVCEGLEFLGIELDKEKNNVNDGAKDVSKDGSKVRIFVIPTNEELMIAMDTMNIVNK